MHKLLDADGIASLIDNATTKKMTYSRTEEGYVHVNWRDAYLYLSDLENAPNFTVRIRFRANFTGSKIFGLHASQSLDDPGNTSFASLGFYGNYGGNYGIHSVSSATTNNVRSSYSIVKNGFVLTEGEHEVVFQLQNGLMTYLIDTFLLGFVYSSAQASLTPLYPFLQMDAIYGTDYADLDLIEIEYCASSDYIVPSVTSVGICKRGEAVVLTASVDSSSGGTLSYRWNTGATARVLTVGPDETTSYVLRVSDGDVFAYCASAVMVYGSEGMLKSLTQAEYYMSLRASYLEKDYNKTWIKFPWQINDDTHIRAEAYSWDRVISLDLMYDDIFFEAGDGVWEQTFAGSVSSVTGFRFAESYYSSVYMMKLGAHKTLSSDVTGRVEQDVGIGLCMVGQGDNSMMFWIIVGSNLINSETGVDYSIEGSSYGSQRIKDFPDLSSDPFSQPFCVAMAQAEANADITVRMIKYGSRIIVVANGETILVCQHEIIRVAKDLHFSVSAPTRTVIAGNLKTLYLSSGSDDEEPDEEIRPLAEINAGQGSAPSLALVIESLSFDEPLRLYKGFREVYLRDKDGGVALYQPTGMDISLPERKSGSADALSFGIGDVSGLAMDYCEKVRTNKQPAWITVYQYAAFNEAESSPDNAPLPVWSLKLFVTGCAITTKGAVFNAGWHDSLNAKFPFRRYTATEFPGLKYVSNQ